MRWLWIDTFVEFNSGKSARAVKNLSLAEDYFADHFPGYPMMPAPLILEGLAQTGGILVGEATTSRKKSCWPSCPRHASTVKCWPVSNSSTRSNCAPSATKGPCGRPRPGGRRVVAEAEIFFAHLDQARSQQLFGDHNFVFSGELKEMLGLARLAAQDGAPLPPRDPRSFREGAS